MSPPFGKGGGACGNAVHLRIENSAPAGKSQPEIDPNLTKHGKNQRDWDLSELSEPFDVEQGSPPAL
jgi:hypothetical protein